jgi:hypothetical protein
VEAVESQTLQPPGRNPNPHEKWCPSPLACGDLGKRKPTNSCEVPITSTKVSFDFGNAHPVSSVFLLSMSERYDARWVDTQVTRCAALWHSCAASPAMLTPRYSLRDHEAREIAYDAEMHAVECEARRAPRSAAARAGAQTRLISSFARFATHALDLEPDATLLLTDTFLPAGIEFARRARAFDPGLSRADTIQACRNAWTACGLQPLLGEPSAITPSILAYSLLYPYTDNYLDSADVPLTAKRSFSQRFRDRLRGQATPILDRREAAVWALVEMIEEEFPRANYPAVFDCLLAIHDAQIASLTQIGRASCIQPPDLLRVSLAKGGTSVLADACLVRGSMTEAESLVAFEWGALLQLGDDLQDIRDDLRCGSRTLFTMAIEEGASLESLLLQLLSFCDRIAERMAALPNGTQSLKDLLKLSWRSLIIGAIAEAHEFFSPAFLAQAERSSPFRFEFLRARHRRLTARQGLYEALFDLFAASPGELGFQPRDSNPARLVPSVV